MPGPPPSPNPRRRNKRPGDAALISLPTGDAVTRKVKIPSEDKAWHVAAKRWWRAQRNSPHADLLVESDWAAAQLLCDWLTELLSEGKPLRASTMQQVWSMMGDLLTTAGARQRLRIAIARNAEGRPEGVPEGMLPPDLGDVYGDAVGD